MRNIFNRNSVLKCSDSLIFIGLTKNDHKSLLFEPALTLKMVPGGHSDLKPYYCLLAYC